MREYAGIKAAIRCGKPAKGCSGSHQQKESRNGGNYC
jgi:hypothetical protein